MKADPIHRFDLPHIMLKEKPTGYGEMLLEVLDL
jgi:hypothetical protein